MCDAGLTHGPLVPPPSLLLFSFMRFARPSCAPIPDRPDAAVDRGICGWLSLRCPRRRMDRPSSSPLPVHLLAVLCWDDAVLCRAAGRSSLQCGGHQASRMTKRDTWCTGQETCSRTDVLVLPFSRGSSSFSDDCSSARGQATPGPVALGVARGAAAASRFFASRGPVHAVHTGTGRQGGFK